MDKKEFWATKSPLPEYHTITFAHPAFDEPIRLVADKFEPVTLGGSVCQPAPMTIKPPDQMGDGTAKLTIAFPRYVVGREFKRKLKMIKAAGSRVPIFIYYHVYLGGDVTTPAVIWNLYVAEAGGITFSNEAVQVSATIDNPMRRQAGTVYDPGVFTGLELI